MTNKLICPVCGAGEVLEFPDGTFACDSEYCKSYEETDTTTYDLLIQSQKDLEIARKALEDIKSDYELYAKQGCRMEPNETDMYNYACNALEQIEHKEQI